MNIEDFPMLKEDLVYLDNGATSLKPQCVIDKMTEYYEKYSANAHRGDYDISFKVDQEYEKTREEVRRFINARFKEEIVFTSGATESLNWIATYFFGKYLEGKRSSLGTTKARRAAGALPQFDCVGFHRECAQGRRSQGDGEVKRLHAGTPSGSYTGSEIRSGEADSGSGGQARYCYVQVRFFEEACLTGGHSNVLIKHGDQKIDSFR